MRRGLQSIGSEDRHVFQAEFVRFGVKKGWTGNVPTVLFKDIRFGDKIVCDHIWFSLRKQFYALDMKRGDIVEFSARVVSYFKGYQGGREDVYKPVSEDWKLSHPTKVKKVGHNDNVTAEPNESFDPKYANRVNRAIDCLDNETQRRKK